MSIAGQHCGGAFGAPPGQAGNAIGSVAGERQQVGNGLRGDTVLGNHGFFADSFAPSPVETDDSLALYELSQVLVWRADYYALHGGVGAKLSCRRSDGVIGLELHHRPDADAQRRNRPLRQFELGQQFRWRAFAGLVPREQVVAEGRYHAVESAPDVSDPILADEAQHALDQPMHRPYRLTGRRLQRRHGEMRAEQLIGAVNQIYVQAGIPPIAI